MGVEVDMAAEKWSMFVLSVTDKDNGGKVLGGDFFQEFKKSVAIDVIQTLSRFIKNEELGAFDKRPGYEYQTLFGKAQTPKGGVAFCSKTRPGEPLPGGFHFDARCLLI